MKKFIICCFSLIILGSSSACSSMFSKEATSGLLIGAAAGGVVGAGIGVAVGEVATNTLTNAAIGAGVGLMGGSFMHDYNERNGKLPVQVVREPSETLSGEILESQQRIDTLRQQISGDTKWQPSGEAVRQLKEGYYPTQP